MKIPVIYYHSVGHKNTAWKKNFLTMELPFFENQLQYFSKNYTTLSLKDYWAICNHSIAMPENPLIITFDDGYLDNWTWGFPLLKKYGLKATIFVNPEFVDQKPDIRPNLEDVWEGNASQNDIRQWGFLSWAEMLKMESSGFIDIQSHTMTHTKYPVSDILTGFHHPGADSLYEIGNHFREKKPYYIEDNEFELLLPYGYPLFESTSAVVAKKVSINDEFIQACISSLKTYNFNDYNFEKALKIVLPIYNKFKKKNRIISEQENEEVYLERIKFEIIKSKEILEKKLNKKIEFLCWPHGDNNELCQNIALDAGYLATSVGKSGANPQSIDRFDRIGAPTFHNNLFLSNLKLHYKIGSYLNKFPWNFINQIYLKSRGRI